jgi:hypothetical protein
MSKVKILSADKLNKKDFFSSLGSLGASFHSSSPSDPTSNLSFEIISQSELHRHHLITETCRKLDTLNIQYEVIK